MKKAAMYLVAICVPYVVQQAPATLQTPDVKIEIRRIGRRLVRAIIGSQEKGATPYMAIWMCT